MKAWAGEIGFDLCGIASATSPITLANFEEWLDRGFAGEMQYLERRRDAYADPERVLGGVASVVLVAVNYHTGDGTPVEPGQGRVARYARIPQDYHDVVREKLGRLASLLHEKVPGCRTRGIVDTAPVLERDFARQAGLGWFGKNTMLIHKRLGSWFLLGGLLTDIVLLPDEPHSTSHCGTCTRCLDACPTDAFPEPYVLDATRCISYHTIEAARLPPPLGMVGEFGDWVFGCDICNEVCPWNRKAPVSSDPAMQPRADLSLVDCVDLLRMDETEFLRRFTGTPLSRPGLVGMQRNAALVLGNSGDRSMVPPLIAARGGAAPVVAAAIEWAIARLSTAE
ncbi:MAG: tRNA epoxyqueuosine(34) reductase QueG [Planctomycetaceae bacterium]